MAAVARDGPALVFNFIFANDPNQLAAMEFGLGWSGRACKIAILKLMRFRMKKSEVLTELDSLMTGFWLTDLANFSAYFAGLLKDVNWIGFYLSDGKVLRLGPFIGKAACVEIAFNRGVCGAAFSKDEILLVSDVHQFPGHIACDPQSRSEMVLPFKVQGKLVGVLDLDSPLVNRFHNEDRELMSEALNSLTKKISSSQTQLMIHENLK